MAAILPLLVLHYYRYLLPFFNSVLLIVNESVFDGLPDPKYSESVIKLRIRIQVHLRKQVKMLYRPKLIFKIQKIPTGMQ